SSRRKFFWSLCVWNRCSRDSRQGNNPARVFNRLCDPRGPDWSNCLGSDNMVVRPTFVKQSCLDRRPPRFCLDGCGNRGSGVRRDPTSPCIHGGFTDRRICNCCRICPGNIVLFATFYICKSKQDLWETPDSIFVLLFSDSRGQ